MEELEKVDILLFFFSQYNEENQLPVFAFDFANKCNVFKSTTWSFLISNRPTKHSSCRTRVEDVFRTS